MKISDLFGRSSVYGNSKSSGASRIDEEERGNSSARVGSDDGSDRTTISSKARVLSQIGPIREEAEAEQSDKVAALKKRIESGEYNVSSQAVAEKLVAFFNERV